MWAWHTETASLQCSSPSSLLEVVRHNNHPIIIAQGPVEDLLAPELGSQSLGELLNRLDRWLEVQQLSAAGIVGFECGTFLESAWDRWMAPNFPEAAAQGENILFTLHAGETTELQSAQSSQEKLLDCQFELLPKNCLLMTDAIVHQIQDIVEQGLKIRRLLEDDHLVVSVPIPVAVKTSLLDCWYQGFQTRFNRGFFMEGNQWELASCTPERFVTMQDWQLQVQLLAGTFRENMMSVDKNRLLGEHRAARSALQTLVRKVGQLEDAIAPEIKLVVDCDVARFGQINHLRSVLETQYHNAYSMLHRLAVLTPSPAAGSHDPQVQLIIQNLESKPRGYYGGCFFLRTPNRMESLMAIRSIFRRKPSQQAELMVGAGFTKMSSFTGELAEILSKAVACAELLGCEVQPYPDVETSFTSDRATPSLHRYGGHSPERKSKQTAQELSP